VFRGLRGSYCYKGDFETVFVLVIAIKVILRQFFVFGYCNKDDFETVFCF